MGLTGRISAMLLLLIGWLSAPLHARAISQGTVSRVYIPAISARVDLRINEFMAANRMTLTDEDGDYSDWIEVVNASEEPVHLAGWYLTDDLGKPAQWPFPPMTLASGEALLVFASGKDRRAAGAKLHANFRLAATGETVALIRPDGSIASQFVDYPPQYADTSYGLATLPPAGQGTAALAVVQYFKRATPGTLNNETGIDPDRVDFAVAHRPAVPAPGNTLTITAQVQSRVTTIAKVTLHYRIMYGPHTSIAMMDDGAHKDGTAGDGVYGAQIPGSLLRAGEMVRYYVTVVDQENVISRWPHFLSATDAAEYGGTVVADSALQSQLPILHWFVEDEAAAQTRDGTRSSLFFEDHFYDNVFVRLRGGVSVSYPKKSFKFEANADAPFAVGALGTPVSEVNLNTTYSDKAYMRQILAYETYRDAGAPYAVSFPLRLERNGNFYMVSLFVEQPDELYLVRQGLDPAGALYKMFNALRTDQLDRVEKKTRLDEGKGDLARLAQGLAESDNDALARYLFDHVNLPAVINYLAVSNIIQQNDHMSHNYFMYRDSVGTGEWQVLPWDEDFTFGRSLLLSQGLPHPYLQDVIWADHKQASHPFFGGQAHTIYGNWNRLYDAIYRVPVTQAMYLRRLRTLMDAFLQPVETPAQERYYETRIDTLATQMRNDVALDAVQWPLDWGDAQTLDEALRILKQEYLNVRRVHLYQTHSIANGGVIPDAQPEDPSITFGSSALGTGEGDDGYVSLVNSHDTAIDVSGWRIDGAVTFVLPPGAVIPARGTLYLSPNVNAFRTRFTSPTRGEGHFVLGNYAGRLAVPDERLKLVDANGRLISQTSTQLASPYAGALIVSELHYHPADGEVYEFIELQNVSDAPLDLTGFQFVDGIDFLFPAGVQLAVAARLVLVQDTTAFGARYGDIPIGGAYEGNLDNGGETLSLVDGAGRLVLRFTYDDDFPWPAEADGAGYSLVYDQNLADLSDVCGWRVSAQLGGSPGADNGAGASTCNTPVYLPHIMKE